MSASVWSGPAPAVRSLPTAKTWWRAWRSSQGRLQSTAQRGSCCEQLWRRQGSCQCLVLLVGQRSGRRRVMVVVGRVVKAAAAAGGGGEGSGRPPRSITTVSNPGWSCKGSAGQGVSNNSNNQRRHHRLRLIRALRPGAACNLDARQRVQTGTLKPR